MKFSMISLGCTKNLVDSEMMMGVLANAGYTYSQPEAAEVVVVNTCGFIESAKQESIDQILEMAELKKTGSLKYLLVTGCLVQRYADELAAELPEVDALIGVGDFPAILKVLNQVQSQKQQVVVVNAAENYLFDHTMPRMQATMPAIAYVKIADGCNNRCSYCAIPMIRGHYRSRTVEDIVAECQDLVANGVREICLIAQDCTFYGKDLYGEYTLGRLCREINKIEELRWLRILYFYPTHFTPDFIEQMATNPKMCQYIDLPLQHCQDSILKAMNRTGSKAEILALIGKLRQAMPDLVLRTSYIAGFPGETPEDVEALRQFILETKFDHVGVFTYSAEEGTTAFVMANQVEAAEKQRRRAIFMEAQQTVVQEKLQRWVGKEIEVLLEKEVSDRSWLGRFRGQAPDIDGLVIYHGSGAVGIFVQAMVTGTQGYDLLTETIKGDGIE